MSQCLLLLLFCLAALPVRSATVLVLQFHNNSEYTDLNWVRESIADTLMTEFAGANEIVLDRTSRAEAIRRMSLRPDGDYTKATLLRLGQSLSADYLCFGSFDITLANPQTPLKESSIRITAQFVDLRKLHDGPEFSEAGRLSELSRLQEHLAYESLKYLQPTGTWNVDQFISAQKTVRLDAEESYVRGLLSSSREQKQKWFLQASALDNKFRGPAFELGKIALEQKQYAQASDWLRKVGAADPNYPEARFKLGLAAFGTGEYQASAGYFREVAKDYPLSEVYNDLGAAELQTNSPLAADDFRRALDGDPKSSIYAFNLGMAMLKANSFDEAGRRFQQVLEREPNDADARTLLEQAKRRDPISSVNKSIGPRLKSSFNETAFRQLKAMLQPEPSHR